MSSLWDLLSDVLPNDHARQITSEYYIHTELNGLPEGSTVVDLGCGGGGSAYKIRRAVAGVKWIGIDIPSSPEVDARRAADDDRVFVSFDGVLLPFADASIDAIYSHQVLEHVRHPEPLLAEVRRVLKPGGAFVGSTSNLEPYHSFSLWNFTPYGFRVITEDAGLVLEELRPCIDGPTLIERSVLGRPKEMSKYFVEPSPLNQQIDEWASETKRRPALVNHRKLMYCGQFAFLARRLA